MKRLIVAAAVAASLAVASPASATIVFSDNFNADALLLNQTVFLGGWTVSDGTVDLVGGGFCDDGRCVDLDGSTGNAGIFARDFLLLAGFTYTASYDIAGNRRGGSDTAVASFGTASNSHTFAASQAYTQFSLVFTPTTTGTYSLSFANNGGDNIGLLLDNVTLDSAAPGGVPEPGAWALMILGFGAVGATLRRRAATAA